MSITSNVRLAIGTPSIRRRQQSALGRRPGPPDTRTITQMVNYVIEMCNNVIARISHFR